MKKVLFLIPMLLTIHQATAQNVGIGELLPGAKLTIKGSDVLNRNLLIKTNTDDTATYLFGYRHFMNGYSSATNSTLTVNNKYFLPFDQPQLSILASGEISGINANGSLSSVEFANINTTSKFAWTAYAGGVNPNVMYLTHQGAAGFKTLLLFKENGHTGLGTGNPVGKLQINHRSSIALPTLNLWDSSAAGGPIIQFGNSGGSANWQLRTIMNTASDEFDFVFGTSTLASLNENGNLGIGINTPQQRLHIHNTGGGQLSYAQFTNSTTGNGGADGTLIGINGVGNTFIYNQEVANIYFGTSNTTRMFIESGGKVGIGTTAPTETLDVDGNINSSGLVRVTGEVNRPSTGAANLVPIAYGNISSTGFIQAGSGNFTVSRFTTGFYVITITGEAYQFQQYITVVTAIGSSAPIICTTGSGGGSLQVFTYLVSGAATDSNFHFVVFKQ